MNNVPGAQGRGVVERKDEDTNAAPLFPSEGTFSAVVPLSEVRAGRDSARDSTALVVAPEKPKESEELKESEEEATLVPARAGRGRLARRAPSPRRESRRWLATTAAVVLSVVAGLAAGAYMVWTQQTRQARPPATQASDAAAPNADAAASSQAAPEAPQPAPAPVEAEVAEAEAEVVKVEPVESREASADDTKPATNAAAKAVTRPAAETASRRDAETEPRAAARERARATTAESTPAPKPAARREPAPRRQTTPERARTSATASRGRALPVSSPPPSARPRTVIQWP